MGNAFQGQLSGAGDYEGHSVTQPHRGLQAFEEGSRRREAVTEEAATLPTASTAFPCTPAANVK